MAILKPAFALVGAIASSIILIACSNPSPMNQVVPSGLGVERVKIANAVVPMSSLNLFTHRIGSDERGLHVVGNITGSRVLYASLLEGQVFHGYTLPKKKPFCQSAPVQQSLVLAIGTDKDGNVWLPTAFFGSPPGIFSFGPNCGAPGPTLSAPVNAQPVGIAFGPDGTKYVLMLFMGPHINTATVSVYAPGATSPTATLTDKRLSKGNFFTSSAVGVDSAGHVYVTCCGQPKGNQYVIVFNGQVSQYRGKMIVLQQAKLPSLSVTFDRSQNMIIPDAGDTTLKVYAPPYTGMPMVYPLKGLPNQCALSRKQGTIACANYPADTVDLYAYPSMSYRYSLKSPDYGSVSIGGVAFSPNQ